MRVYIPTILPSLLPLLQSPLTAPIIMPVFLKLGQSAFSKEQKNLGKCVSINLRFFSQNFLL